ncbi:MAG: hypothetical protein QG673_281 [Pseudomonadota bacterium]|nr:hypothetical protein [Pseudomonadota bacterium]
MQNNDILNFFSSSLVSNSNLEQLKMNNQSNGGRLKYSPPVLDLLDCSKFTQGGGAMQQESNDGYYS